MAYTPISNSVLQYSKNSGGAAASGYYLKFYASGTTTPISMATDSSGGTLLAKCQLNTLGYPINGSSDVFIPHIDQDYKLALYENSTDADNNTLASAAWIVDNLATGDESLRSELIAANGTALITHTQSGTNYNLATYLNEQKWTNVINVKASPYNAKGDGTTDDTAAIMAASDALTSNCVLYFPPGDYVVSHSATRDDIVYINGLANVTISGYGAKLTTDNLSLAGNEINLIGINNSTRVVIEGLNLDINVTAVVGCNEERARLIYGYKPTSASTVIEDVTIRDCRLSILNTAPTGDIGTDSVEGDSVKIPEGDNDAGHTNKYKLECIHFVGDEVNEWSHKAITVDSCRFEECTARAFWIWHCEDIVFTNNTMQNKGARRPQIRCIVSNKNLKVDNNTFIDANTNGDTNWIYCNRQAGVVDSGEATISNNTFYYGIGACIELDAFSNAAITGNTFRVSREFNTANFDSSKNYTCQRGIKLSQNMTTSGITENVSISGNSFNGGDISGTSTYPANFVYAISDNAAAPVFAVTITGNTIMDCGTAEGISGGIVLGSVGFIQGFTVTGNTFHNNNTGLSVVNAFKGTVSGNTFSGVGGAGNGIYIASDGFLTNVLVVGNNFNDLNRGINATSGTWPTVYRVLMDGSSGTFTGTLTGSTSGATATIGAISTYNFNQANYDQSITVTSPSGTFDPGETVTATGGGTATVTEYFPASEQFMVLNNTFTNIADVGIRNYGSNSPIFDNLFINSPSQLQTPAGIASFTASNQQKVI